MFKRAPPESVHDISSDDQEQDFVFEQAPEESVHDITSSSEEGPEEVAARYQRAYEAGRRDARNKRKRKRSASSSRSEDMAVSLLLHISKVS